MPFEKGLGVREFSDAFIAVFDTGDEGIYLLMWHQSVIRRDANLAFNFLWKLVCRAESLAREKEPKKTSTLGLGAQGLLRFYINTATKFQCRMFSV